MYNIAEYLFRKKFFFNFVTILQLAICISFTNYGFLITNTFFRSYNETYKFNNAYFMNTVGPFFRYTFDKESFEENGNKLEFCYYPVNTEKYTITMFGEKTLEIYSKSLIKGKLEKSQSNIVNCFVVGNKTLYNKTIEITINGIDYKFYVTGILSEKTKNIATTPLTHGSGPEYAFKDFNSSVINIVCLDEDTVNLHYNSPTSTSVVYLAENEKSNIDNLSQYGTIISMEEFRHNADNNREYMLIRVFSHLSRGAGIVSIISMICMFILNIKGNENMFKTFKQLGLKMKHIISISSIYMTFFNTLLLIMSGIFIFLWHVIIDADINNFSVGINNYIFTITTILLTFAINIICSYYILFKEGEKNE